MTTPGLTALTRILRSFRSIAQPRARLRTAALVAEYTLNAGVPVDAAVDGFRTIELALGNSGSAFCTVRITPLTLLSKVAWYCCSVIDPSGRNVPPPALAKTMS